MKIAVLPGDGIGNEIVAQALKVLKRLGLPLETAEAPVGGAGVDAEGEPLPARTLALAREADAILFGAVGDARYDSLPRAKRPEQAILARQTFLIHNELPESFVAWKDALGMRDLDPMAIDHFDSGQIILEAAAQGLGIAIMHDDHLRRADDDRLTELFDVEVESPYSYWFVCKPTALESRPVRLFHDWLVKADL